MLGFIPTSKKDTSLTEIPPQYNVNLFEVGISYVAGIMTFSTGIFLTAIRMYEPLFRFMALQKIY
jgi:hypothetical protein